MYTDQYLLELLNTNHEKAAILFVEEYSSLLSDICAKSLSNPEDVNECVNDTFATFFLNADKYNPSKGSVKNYLCGIAEHKSVDLFRKNCHRMKIEKELAQKSKEDYYEQKYQTEENTQLNDALDKLPPLDRQILKMHYYEEKSYKEISDELHMSYEKVRKRGLRGKKKLLVLLLIALLIFGITACTTIVLKKEGLLPTWFPFYEWIPVETPEKENEETSNIITIPDSHQFTRNSETDDSNIEETPIIIPATTSDAEKYYFSPERGILDADKPAYRSRKNTQQFERNGIRYELLDSFYYDGQLDIYLLATVTDTERWTLPPAPDNYSAEETREYLEKYHNIWDDEFFLWGSEEADNYIPPSYIITPQGTKIQNFSHASDCYDDNFNMRLYELSFSWSPQTKNISSLEFDYILFETMQFQMVLDLVSAKEFKKPSVDNNSSNEEAKNNTPADSDRNPADSSSDYFELETGICALSDNMAIIQLYQKNIDEYEIVDWISQNPLNFYNGPNHYPSLTDTSGTSYNYMRVSAQAENDVSENHKKFEIYFRNIAAGKYKLKLPVICLKKSDISNKVTIPLPTGKEPYIDCDITLLFSDGNGMHITGMERSEYTDIYYTGNQYGVTALEFHTWRYRPVFEPISSSNDLILFGADAAVAASNNAFSNGSINVWDSATREMCYFFEVESEDMPKSLTVQFSNPVFLLNQEFCFDVTVQD